MVKFHETLSERSVYFRYFHMMKLGQRIAHERLTRICFIDYDRDMALVAEARDEQHQPYIVGVGRLTKQRGTNVGEFAITISDGFQGAGLGTELLRGWWTWGGARGSRRSSPTSCRRTATCSACRRRSVSRAPTTARRTSSARTSR